MSQRPPITHHESSERSEAGSLDTHERDAAAGVPPLLAEVAVFVVPGKLDLREVYERIDALGGERVLDPDAARIVVTGLRGVPRLERALGRNLHDRVILTASYIDAVHDAARAAGPDWRDRDVPPLPDWAPFALTFRRPSVEPVSPPRDAGVPRSPPGEAGPPAKRTRVSSPDPGARRGAGRKEGKPGDMKTKGNEDGEDGEDDETGDGAEDEGQATQAADEADEAALIGPPVGTLKDVQPYEVDIDFADIPRMAVLRPSPLVCVNQDIIDAIKPIYQEREYDEGQQLNSNVLSYRRSMAILKAVPRRIRSGAEAQSLVDVGGKVANRIDEYLATGAIAECEGILASERFRALREFASVFTIGSQTAVQLWNAGCRTLDDVLVHYDWVPPATPREERKARKRRMEGTMGRAEVVHAWVKLRGELDEQISRKDVAAISSLVREHLRALRADTQQVIAGGFRRGKQDTGDVDVIFTAGPYPTHTPEPPAAGDAFGAGTALGPDPTNGLLFRLVRRLCRLGLVTHVLQLTHRARAAPLHSSGANFDNLDKAFVILRIGGKHRRVDLICAPRARYAAAVLSWSGSMMFERDLRRYVEDRGLKFRAGLLDPHTQRELNFATEREIFAFLELPFVPPRLRNADG